MPVELYLIKKYKKDNTKNRYSTIVQEVRKMMAKEELLIVPIFFFLFQERI